MWLLLKWKLKASDPTKRIAAINEVATSRDPRAATLIAETLVRAIDLAKAAFNRPSGSKGDSVKDIIDNANVQRAAADALGHLGDSCSFDPLVRALNDGSEEYVRIAAANALGRIKDRRAVGPLLAMISKWQYSWGLLAAAAAALGDIGDPAAVAPLQSLMEAAQKRYDDLRSREGDRTSRQRYEDEEDLRDVNAALKDIPQALYKLVKTSPAGAPPQPQAAPNLPATTSDGIATMLRVCSNHQSRFKPIESDALFKQSVQQLKLEGAAGAQALAALINELLPERCIELQDVLLVAGHLSPHPELVSALQRVLSAPAVIPGQTVGNRFRPIIVGEGKIGWDGSTAELMKRQASEALRSLGG